MASAMASPEGWHDEAEERGNLRGSFSVDEEEPMRNQSLRLRERRSRETKRRDARSGSR
jgi:hypothetical protein